MPTKTKLTHDADGNPMPNKLGRHRLFVLARFLSLLRDDRFDLKHWRSDDFDVKDCGTTACAGGWATTLPSFRRAGLKFTHDVDFGLTPTFQDKIGYFALEDFFNINNSISFAFFCPEKYVSSSTPPKRVAQRITTYLKTGKII